MEINHQTSCLVDYSGIGKTIGDLMGRFSTLNFFDFCVIAEGIVLHDKIIVAGWQKAMMNKWEEHLQPLFNSGVLLNESKKSNPVNLKEDKPTDYGVLLDAWYETGRLLGAEAQHRCSALPLLRQKPFYEKNARAREHHSICDLISKYKNLVEALFHIRKYTAFYQVDYIVAPIPPISLQMLQRSTRPDRLLEGALSLRDDYRSLRESLCKLRQDLADPETSPWEKARIINSWEKSWQTLMKYNTHNSLLQIANTSNQFIDIKGVFEGVDVKPSKIIEKIIEHSEKKFHEWRIRPLHNTARNYLKTNDAAINTELRRLFKYEIGRKDIAELEKVGIKII